MKHALVTGAAGAIGAAIARELHARSPSTRLSLVDVDPRVGELASELGGVAMAWDLADPASLDALAGDLPRSVDLLVNCAGIMEVRSLAATPWELAARLMRIDLESPLKLMSIFAPEMIARREGAIVNVSSMAGITPIRGCAYYAASKAGLAAASEIARLELAPHGVRVVTVYPGPVRSELERRARAQLPRARIARMIPMGDAGALAALVLDAVEKNRGQVVYPPLYRLAHRFPVLAGRVTSAMSPIPNDER